MWPTNVTMTSSSFLILNASRIGIINILGCLKHSTCRVKSVVSTFWKAHKTCTLPNQICWVVANRNVNACMCVLCIYQEEALSSLIFFSGKIQWINDVYLRFWKWAMSQQQLTEDYFTFGNMAKQVSGGFCFCWVHIEYTIECLCVWIWI